FLRVRAVQSCGSVGANSPVAGILLTAAPASYVITQAGPSWTAVKGGPPPSANVVFRNVGGLSGRLVFQSTGGFFTFSPSLLDLAPGGEGAVTLIASASALSKAGLSSGRLVASTGS